MEDLTNMMCEAARSLAVQLSEESLTTVGALASEMVDLENRKLQAVVSEILAMEPSIPELEEALSARKSRYARISEVEIPAALEEHGISSVSLVDGSEISIKDEVYAGITENNREAAFDWLKRTNNDGIIKNEVQVPFGKGQEAQANELLESLTAGGYSFTNRKSVHPSTLKAFVRKCLEDGMNIPFDAFSIHVKKVTKIKTKK